VTGLSSFDFRAGAWLETSDGGSQAGAEEQILQTSLIDAEVADSWLMVEGRVRGLDRHWARFAASCQEIGLDRQSLADAWAALPAVLPSPGEWFPRLELRQGSELWLLLRPAPKVQKTVTAWIRGAHDPRVMPRRKGPELGLLGSLRAEAIAHGGQEAVLVDRDGYLLEGAYSSLLWWEGETLCAVSDEAPILGGVTRGLLLDLATEAGVAIRYARPRPEDIADCEAWLVSALHGVRSVTAWVDGGPPAGEIVRATTWQARLEALMS